MPARSISASIWWCVRPWATEASRPIFSCQNALDQAGRMAMISGVIGLTTQSMARMLFVIEKEPATEKKDPE
jgi:hypothetical protein